MEPQWFMADEKQPLTFQDQPDLSGPPREAKSARSVPCSPHSMGPHNVTMAP